MKFYPGQKWRNKMVPDHVKVVIDTSLNGTCAFMKEVGLTYDCSPDVVDIETFSKYFEPMEGT